ncbi:MAG: GDSL-type esterase/lipase family protein [Firmicutes bacterium]|nr:GDSL-type esterase/lipase family protein [Bacillota bacterium]MCM1402007.1 GDSL-type esterase/lipase family protein [Bacteroides sp.]MCM1477935.1 GDSL-type esterase/lipase family protein [Bacteroides sp.]
MKFLRKTLILSAATLLACVSAVASAQSFDGTVVSLEIDDESEVREDSVVIEGWEFEDFEVKVPRFVKLNSNHINMNGANWDDLKKRLANHDNVPFSIVHIGDSHLQADISTGYVRQQMQFDYGDAGRGLVVPLKLGRTNEPVDYFFKSDNSWQPLKFMSAHWPRTMGFTGVSLKTSSPTVNINIGSRVTDTYSTFSDVVLYHKGDLSISKVTLDNGEVIDNPAVNYFSGVTRLMLPKATGNVTITFVPEGDFLLFGAYLSGNRPGVYYNVIGNNGATYNSYNRVPRMGAGVASMHPDLVIVSLGTNEAFGNVSEPRMIDAIDKLVSEIKRTNPNASILLTTPMECQRRSGRGYVINHNVKTIRNIIMQYGKDHHIPVYDWYSIAGGDNASTKWIGEGLYGGDRIHHTVKGYKLQGFMLYDALTKALN